MLLQPLEPKYVTATDGGNIYSTTGYVLLMEVQVVVLELFPLLLLLLSQLLLLQLLLILLLQLVLVFFLVDVVIFVKAVARAELVLACQSLICRRICF